MNDLISVVVPIYNVEQFLRKCLESIINQSYRNIEIILVDDGSTDQCPAICEEYKKIDQRIKVIHKKNGGLSDARNIGIDAAQGEYLVFVDSDDYIHMDMIKKLYEIIIKDSSDLAICNYKVVDEYGSVLETSKRETRDELIIGEKEFWEEYYNNQNGYYIVAWNKLYKKSLFLKERYDVGKIHEDELICHRIIAQCKKISCLEEQLYFYLKRNNSIMQQNYSQRNFDIVEAIINRSLYLYEIGMQRLSEKALSFAISRMLYIAERIDLNESVNICRYKKEKKSYNQAYFVIIKGKCSLKFLINGFSFVLGKNIYKITHFYKRIRK